MILLRLQQLILLVFVTYTIALAAVWSKVSRVFKITRKAESELDSDTFVRLSSDTKNNRNILRALASSAQSMLSGRSSYDYHLALEDDVNDMKELGTAAGRRFHLSGLADWIEAPRDAANLPHIIQATRSQDPCEKEYAFGEMLKVVERLDPLAHVTLVDSALSCVVDWIKERPLIERHVSMVLDPLPLLVDYASRHESLRRHIDPMIAYLVRELGYPAVTSNRAVFGVGVLLERGLIPQDALRNQIIPILFDLIESKGDDPGMEDRRVEIAAVLCRVVSSGMITDKRWLFDNFIADYSRFLEHHVVHIRKAAVAVLADLSRIFGQKFTELFIVPHLSCLCMDANWGVRKAVCEVFVEVARHTSPSVRRLQLAQTFVKLLHDPSRWVWYTAFQELGPFIATFANSKLSGLKIKDGQVCETDGRDPENVVADMVEFEKLPAGCYMPEKETEEEEADDSGQESDPGDEAGQLIDGLQHMLDTWTAGQKKASTRSAPPSVIEGEASGSGERVSIAAKCNSSDDLSKIGLDDSELNEEDEDLFNTTLNSFNDSTSSEEQDDSVTEPSSANASDFSPVSYWSDSYDSFADDDELVEFGSAKSVPCARSFLERRFDVLYVSPERNATPAASPRRTPRNSESERTISEGDDMCARSPSTRKSSESTKADDSDIFVDCRSEHDEQEDSYDEDSVQKIVPQELVDNFMGMVLPGGMMDSDINRHCAHNFPAVAYTLGRANWPQLRDTYNKLATDDQLRVRVSIANSIHEMAAIVGARHTDDDLLPVFHAYREDAFEVRVGLLKHLFEFYRCLSPETRKGMIDALPQFMPMDNSMLNGNWRYRHEFAKQCNKLCEMYGIEEINRTMSAIALTLANDRVSEVRKEAVHLLSQILARLVDHEWADLTSKQESSVDSPSPATLTELFVHDLVSGFANTQKWTRRQTFAYVCERVLLDHALSMEQFRYFLLPHLIAMADDSVVNVRIAVCRALSLCDSSVQSHAIASDSRRLSPLTVETVLERLAADPDMDVARAARQAMGQTVGNETVDVSMRGFRIREKENAFLDVQLVDNYEEDDMSLCSDYTSSETPTRNKQMGLSE